MSQPNKNKKNIVITDDNFIARYAISKAILSNKKEQQVELNILTSSNGLEGLGLIIATDPEIVVLDATLPRYSGRELFEFIATNPKIKNSENRVILLTDEKFKEDLPKNFDVLKYNDGQLLSKIVKESTNKKSLEHDFKFRLLETLFIDSIKADKLIELSDKSAFPKKLVLKMRWFLLQLKLSLYLSLAIFLLGKLKEGNVDQKNLDLKHYRVRYYPTFITTLAGLFLFLLQFILYVTGGIVIMGTEINSIFAAQEEQVNIDLNDAYISKGLVRKKNGSVELEKLSKTESITKEPTGLIVTGSSKSNQASINYEASNLRKTSEFSNQYSTKRPFLQTTQPIKLSRLIGIIEESSINDKDSSIQENTNFYRVLENKITYQISPNSIDWYYFNIDKNSWEPTQNEWTRSNSVQEINLSAERYSETIGGNNIYIRAYFHTDGETQVTLKNLTVIKEIVPISSRKYQDIENFRTANKPTFPKDIYISPTSLITQATNTGVLSGIIYIPESEKDIHAINLELYSIDEENNAKPIRERIDLNRIEQTEYIFEYEIKDPEYSGFQLVLKNNQDEIISASTKFETNTVYVNTTKDDPDFNLNDNICDSDKEIEGAQCTLRAAIQELNNLTNNSSKTINFNIPTTDPNFVDYDFPKEINSGDNMDDDDYWSIVLDEKLPDIETSNLRIDGATQSDFTGETNTQGPEIEISGSRLQSSPGFIFTSSATNCSIDHLVINSFYQGTGTNRYAIGVFGNNFSLTNSYIGTDVLGKRSKQNYNDMLVAGVNEISIGSNEENRNNFGSRGGVYIVCPENSDSTNFNLQNTEKLEIVGNCVQ